MQAWRVLIPALAFAALLVPSPVSGQTTAAQDEAFKPTPGQPGKDVVWVPTPEPLVEKMLDVANVQPSDLVVDLGSGDGRNVIAAARRGARGRGVEYNPDMVALSRRNAARQGVADRALFVEGDMFAADFSDATVLALFLLPDNMNKLRDKFFAMRPGSRIVANTFGMDGWQPDEKHVLGSEDDCASWCTALLWIVPAKVAGTWRLGDRQLTLTQEFQRISGTLAQGGTTLPITEGRLRGAEISFSVGSARYSGIVKNDSIAGVVRTTDRTANWTAARPSQ